MEKSFIMMFGNFWKKDKLVVTHSWQLSNLTRFTTFLCDESQGEDNT